MIAQLTGTVARVADTAGYLVLDVHGVGYKVSVPVQVLATLPGAGQPLVLIIHTIVREDEISLYGFIEESDLRVFDLLLTVTGIGPKVAMGLLSALPAVDLAQAIGSDDVRTLTKAPGIGAKTAQRMVLELKDKIAALGFSRKVDQMAQTTRVKALSAADIVLEDVSSALLNLGYNKADSQRAAEAALEASIKTGAVPEFAPLLRAALGRLTGSK